MVQFYVYTTPPLGRTSISHGTALRLHNTPSRPYGAHLEVHTPNSVVIEAVRNEQGTSLALCSSYGSLHGAYYCELDDKLDRYKLELWKLDL